MTLIGRFNTPGFATESSVYKTKYAWGDPTPYKLSSVNRLFYDSMGNLWLQSGDGLFVIYNPDGIKGLTSLKGKWTKNELPKEED